MVAQNQFSADPDDAATKKDRCKNNRFPSARPFWQAAKQNCEQQHAESNQRNAQSQFQIFSGRSKFTRAHAGKAIAAPADFK